MAGLARTVIGFVIGGLMIALIGLIHGLPFRALPLTGAGGALTMAAFGRTNTFIAGRALTLGDSCVVALSASAVMLLFHVVFPSWLCRARFTVSPDGPPICPK